jgi:hypothetical protein
MIDTKLLLDRSRRHADLVPDYLSSDCLPAPDIQRLYTVAGSEVMVEDE